MTYYIDFDYSAIEFVQTAVYRAPVFAAAPAGPTPSQRALIERNNRIRRHIAVALAEAREDHIVPSRVALANVEHLLHLLPPFLPETEPYVSYAGSLCFDWDEDSKNQISIMLQEGSRISFAAYFSGEKVNGAYDFSSTELPGPILASIETWKKRRDELAT